MCWDSERMTLSLLQSTLHDFKSCTQIEHIRFTADTEEISKNLSKELKDVHNNDEKYHIETRHECQYESISNVLEKAQNDLSRTLCRKHGYPIDVLDLKGNGIKRAKTYLEKLARIDFSDLESEWSYLEILNKVRNFIVHSQGEIVYSQGELEKFKKHHIEQAIESSQYPGLSLSGGHYSLFLKPLPIDLSEETAKIVNEINEISDHMKGNLSLSDQKRLKKIKLDHPDLFMLVRTSLNIVIEQDYIEYSIDKIGSFLGEIYKKAYPKAFSN